jgi:Bacteriocin-protection, YdeI or OmpD-Associated/Domain of unknown function (DUF1905)
VPESPVVGTYTPGPTDGIEPPPETAPAFTARVHRLEEINFAVEVPAAVSAWFDRNGPVPVYGLLGSTTIRATMVPTGGGRHRVYLNGPMRIATGTGEGDEVHLTLWLDEDPREVEVPDDLRCALVAAGALEAFAAWAPSHRREYVRAIESVKRPETRAKYVQRTVDKALAGS